MRLSVEFLQAGYSVSDVAFMVGYKEYNNFTRKFKSFYGYLPSQVKKNIYGNTIPKFKFRITPAD